LVLTPVGAPPAAAATPLQEEKRGSEAARKMQEPHPSHAVVHQAVMAKTGGKHPSPMELAVQVDVAYAQQAKQHQMLAHQAQQAAQLQAQQAAAPPPPGQQAAAGAAGGGGGPSPGQQAGPGGGPGPAQGLPAAAQGLAAGTPSAPPGLVGPPPQQQQQQQQHSLPGSATPPLPVGTPGLVAGSSLPAQGQGGTPGPQGQLPPPAGVQGQPAPGPRPGQPQITLQQLNHILETGKLPNGQVSEGRLAASRSTGRLLAHQRSQPCPMCMVAFALSGGRSCLSAMQFTLDPPSLRHTHTHTQTHTHTHIPPAPAPGGRHAQGD
jgi:hypothetical protein